MQADRAQGCLIGQLTGNDLGSRVQFQSLEEIRRSYPDGVPELADGAEHDTPPPGKYRLPRERLTAVVLRVPEMETVPNKQEPISIPASSFITKSLSGARIFHLAKHNLSFGRPQTFIWPL